MAINDDDRSYTGFGRGRAPETPIGSPGEWLRRRWRGLLGRVAGGALGPVGGLIGNQIGRRYDNQAEWQHYYDTYAPGLDRQNVNMGPGFEYQGPGPYQGNGMPTAPNTGGFLPGPTPGNPINPMQALAGALGGVAGGLPGRQMTNYGQNQQRAAPSGNSGVSPSAGSSTWLEGAAAQNWVGDQQWGQADRANPLAQMMRGTMQR